MDFYTLSRRQLQSLCKKNKIPANITNLAMADALTSSDFVEGIEEILNTSEFGIKGVGMLKTPRATPTTAARRRAAASTSVRRMIEVSNESLDVKRDVSVKTPASRRRVVCETSSVNHGYNTRRSARLAEKNVVLKERSEVIKINSFTEEINENVEAEINECSVDQNEISEITVVDNLKECSEECEVKSNDKSNSISEGNSYIPNGGEVAVASIERRVASDIKNITDQEEGGQVDGLMAMSINVCGMKTEGLIQDTKIYSNEAEETVTYTEDTENNSNGGEEVNSSFKDIKMNSNVDEDLKASVDPNVENIGMSSNVAEETEVFIEKDAEKNSNEDEEVNSSFEDTKKASIDSTVDEETSASPEVIAINTDVNGETKTSTIMKVGEETKVFTVDTEMNSDVDKEAKSSSEITPMNSNLDEEMKAPIADNGMISEVDEESKVSIVAEFKGDDNKESDMSNENETSDDEESDMSDEIGASVNEKSEMSNISADMDATFTVNVQETDEYVTLDDEELFDMSKSDMDANLTVDVQETDEYEISDDEELVSMSNITSNMDANLIVNAQETDEYETSDDEELVDMTNITSHMVANVTVNIQDTNNKKSDMPDGEQEDFVVPEVKIQDGLGNKELVDDKHNFVSDFTDDVLVTGFDQEEVTIENEKSADMAANVTVNVQETDNKESDMSKENETSDDDESDTSDSDENETLENEKSEISNISADMDANLTVNVQETDNKESDMLDENETSDDDESDMSDSDENGTFENEKSEFSNISADMDANLTVNVQETDEYETSDDEELVDMSNVAGDMVTNVTVNIQDTDFTDDIITQDGLGNEELMDDKHNFVSDFTDDVIVTGFDQEEVTLENEKSADMAANVTVNVQETSDDEESDMSDENETSDDEESDTSDENETSDDEESDMSNISADMDANLTMNVQETDEYETSDDEELVDMSNIAGDMVANVSVNIQDTDNKKSDMPDGDLEDFVVPEAKIHDDLVDKHDFESNFADDVLITGFNQEDMTIPEDVLVADVKNQDELLNSKAKHESNFSAIGYAAEASTDVSDPVHIVTPLPIVDLVFPTEPVKKSLSRTPLKKSASRLTKVADDKENVDSGRKSVIVIDKKPLEDTIWELSKKLKENVKISEEQTKEDGKEDEAMMKATPTRPALKTLSENCIAAESQN